MVLQRDRPIIIFGTSRPSTLIQVRLGDVATSTKSSSDGQWQARLPARPYSTIPVDLAVRDDQDEQVLHDILIGDIWLATGQSNMEFPLSRDQAAKQEIPQAHYPLLRLRNHTFAGQYHYASALDQETVDRLTPHEFFSGHWETCSPESVSEMSAVGYYFARKLVKSTGVPIGIVNFSIGGAPIETFISQSALQHSPDFDKKIHGNWLDNPSIEESFVRLRARQHIGGQPVPHDDFGPNHGYKPGFAWAAGPGKITRCPIAGVLWYQGESNAIREIDVKEYAGLMKLMMSDWREQWHLPELPFLWCQLPSIDEPARKYWPEFREVQRTLLAQPDTGMAVTLDLGAAHDVHPRKKLEVGERLARWALYYQYGQHDHLPSGPLPLAATHQGNTLLISFRHAQGLHLKPEDKALFEVADSTQAFVACVAEVQDQHLVIKLPKHLNQPTLVRYAWAMNAEAALVNQDNLPASPFILNVSP
jgi:sialate O-acetylesterase